MYSLMTWQKPARIAVAIVGLASAAGVYFVMGQRRVAPPSAPIMSRVPDANVELSDCNLMNFPGLSKNFEVECEHLAQYPDGATKLTGVKIRIHKAEGRTFTVLGTEAKVGKGETQFEVFGTPLRLEDSDGFWLETDRATVSRLDQISHVPGAATFGKGRMSGSGTGFSYDNNREVLLISQQARVRTVDERGKVVTDLASNTATLDRLQHLLTLDTDVHVIREDQVIDADHASGRLSASNDIVTLIELFGNSRVSGGPSIDAMSARDITLDYTEDGKTLEASKLVGAASIAMKGEGEGAGRRIQGEIVDVTLAPDGTLTSVSARPGAEPDAKVRLDLPASGDAPARSITARTLDGTGQPGKGLTQTTFTGGVLYEEHALRSKAAAVDKQTGMRTARSQRLEASLADDAVTDAVFSIDTTFEDAGLKACAAQANYNPQKGTLVLSGATKAGAPMVADEQMAIEAPKIDVALDTRKMTALGSRTEKLTTFMRSPRVQRCKPSTERPKSEQSASKVPGLLKSDVQTTVVVLPKSAAGVPSLVYDSQSGLAIYSGGRATLEQEDASIVADRLSLDQNKADLTATGSAFTKLRIDDKVSEGRAHEVHYVDATRKLTYSTQPKTPGTEVSLRSEDSVIRAGNIVVTLAAKENKAETMIARGNVRAVEGPQNVIGATLEYTASDDRFKVKGDGSRPAAAASLEDGRCRISTAELITFGKGSSNVSAEGEQSRSRTEPAKAGACTPPAPPTVPTR